MNNLFKTNSENFMIKYYFKKLFQVLLITFVTNSTALAAAPVAVDDEFSYDYASINGKCQVYDPYESINRKFFFFNGVLDTIITRPTAKIYNKLTNDYTKIRVNNFLNNFEEPLSSVNYAIQGKGEGMLKTFWRFAINSTLGIGGLFDVAGKFGLQAKPQRFSDSLGHYGVGTGPYLVIPFLGSTTARDAGNVIITNKALNPLQLAFNDKFSKVVVGVNLVHKRDKVMPFTDHVVKTSTDPYIAIRNAYIQQSEDKMDYPDNFICPAPGK